jgi:hypothetical protein
LLYPGEKRDRPIISYKIEEGSVKHILKTSIQYIMGFKSVIGQVNHIQNIDFLDYQLQELLKTFKILQPKKILILALKLH